MTCWLLGKFPHELAACSRAERRFLLTALAAAFDDDDRAVPGIPQHDDS